MRERPNDDRHVALVSQWNDLQEGTSATLAFTLKESFDFTVINMDLLSKLARKYADGAPFSISGEDLTQV